MLLVLLGFICTCLACVECLERSSEEIVAERVSWDQESTKSDILEIPISCYILQLQFVARGLDDETAGDDEAM